MNGPLRVIFYIIVGVIFFFGNLLYAQDGNIVYVQTWDFEMPDDGSWSEFDSLSTLVNKKVVSKNSKILSQRIIRHQFDRRAGAEKDFAKTYGLKTTSRIFPEKEIDRRRLFC